MPPKPKTSAAARAAAATAHNGLALQGDSRQRVLVERVTPEIDGGRYPAKRVVGDVVTVECDAFADGHDVLAVALRYCGPNDDAWREAPMHHVLNDRWRGTFTVAELGCYRYSVVAWIDRFATWEHQLHKRVEADQDVHVDLLIGAALVAEAVAHAPGAAAAALTSFERALREGEADAGFSPELAGLMARHLPRRYATHYARELSMVVDRPLARCSAWYELFPRSTSPELGRHGTFRDLIARLPYVAELGFDVLYMPPIHPIGMTFRKGKDNRVTAEPGEPGSPWAIGSPEGGHKDIHPELGTLEDFQALVQSARDYGLEVALDIAFQCSPDHPYVREHPEWFRARPDGTIQYAENPPKKYQDIYPFDFETEAWEALWLELKSIFDYWIAQGVHIFRVDNPHTKALPFWEWCFSELKREHPELIFLAEAFTRPKLMYSLAKSGFTQGYTYFTWRTTKWELTQYMLELTQSEVAEFFQPNFWPNTPDILTPQFYAGHRSTFLVRAALAATLAASWGLYGPVYELLVHRPATGREEYADNEKYEIHTWNVRNPGNISWFIAGLNRIRRNNPALHTNERLRFHRVDLDFHENEQIIAYSKATPDLDNIILVLINLHPTLTQRGWVQVPVEEWGLAGPYEAHDLISDVRFIWNGEFNYVELSPETIPVHILRLQRQVRAEPQVGDYA